MNRITHECLQGGQEWLDLRAHYFTASELAAAAGESKYQKRGDLLKAKATGIAEEIDAAKQRLFDAGHAAEAAARPIVEAMIGKELFPVTMSCEIDGLPLLASLDGIDMLGDDIWENKLLNDSLKNDVLNGWLSTHYAYQIEQQLLVSGAGRCFFTTSDGTPEGTFGMWYESDPELRAKIVSIWKQFAEDLANYQHTEATPAAVAEAIDDLPALTVQLVGQVTASNLEPFKAAVTARIQAINTNLVTDADFATADKMVKFLDDGEKRLDLVKAQALAQTESIDQLFRTIDSLKAEMRSKRLTLDKLVKAEKENRKAEIISGASKQLGLHIIALQERVGVQFMPAVASFTEVTKGLKSLDSMRDKVSVALANAKIEANAVADLIDYNIKTLTAEGHDWKFLFPDLASVVTKAKDDFTALLMSRVSQHKESEAKRLEAEREKIRIEEQAKAQREAAEKAAAEKREADAKAAAEQAERNRVAAEEIRKLDEERKASMAASCVEEKPKSETQPVFSIASDTQTATNDCLSSIKLGEICARLGYTVSAEFLSSLGIDPVATEKNAKLYPAAQFPTICRKIADHTLAVAFRKAA